MWALALLMAALALTQGWHQHSAPRMQHSGWALRMVAPASRPNSATTAAGGAAASTGPTPRYQARDTAKFRKGKNGKQSLQERERQVRRVLDACRSNQKSERASSLIVTLTEANHAIITAGASKACLWCAKWGPSAGPWSLRQCTQWSPLLPPRVVAMIPAALFTGALADPSCTVRAAALARGLLRDGG